MLNDEWEGKGLDHPEVRKLFTREYLLASDWYAARLKAKQAVDHKLWRRHVEYLDKFLKRTSHADEAARLGIADRLDSPRPEKITGFGRNFRHARRGAYLSAKICRRTLGAEPD